MPPHDDFDDDLDPDDPDRDDDDLDEDVDEVDEVDGDADDDADDDDDRDEDEDEDLDDDFPLGDGDAETATIAHCPYCGEAVEVLLDAGGGDAQEYVEDCEVCCRPWRVTVRYRRDGSASVRLQGLDD